MFHMNYIFKADISEVPQDLSRQLKKLHGTSLGAGSYINEYILRLSTCLTVALSSQGREALEWSENYAQAAAAAAAGAWGSHPSPCGAQGGARSTEPRAAQGATRPEGLGAPCGGGDVDGTGTARGPVSLM